MAENPQGVLQPIPRRVQVVLPEVAQEPPRIQRVALPKPGPGVVLVSLIAWSGVALRYYCRNLLGRLTGRSAQMYRAKRLKQSLIEMGGTALKFGQLMSMRLDILPLEHCNELSTLRDHAPPFSVDKAIARIEAAIGKPLDQVFSTFDPNPIRSDSTSCLYQAVLHPEDTEKATSSGKTAGEQVIVRVRRPDVEQRLAADLVAINFVLMTLETLTVVRPGTFARLREEWRHFVEDGLDFLALSRFQRLFRRLVKRDDIRWANAAKVHHHLSSENVLVTRFVPGVHIDEIIAARMAAEAGDGGPLRQLQRMGIDPRKVARRLVQLSWWGTFESMFFQAPEARHIIVQPGNQIWFTELNDCGSVSAHTRSLHQTMLRRMSRDDVGGAADALVRALAPLPLIDTHELTKMIEQALWPQLFAMRDPEAHWARRTSAGIWVAVLQAAQTHRVPVKLTSIRMMRSALMHELLAARLNPRIDILREFERYRSKADARSGKRMRDDLRALRTQPIGPTLLARLADANDRMEQFGFFLENVTNNLPVEFFSLSGKAAYASSVLLRFALGILGLAALFTGGVVVNNLLFGMDISLTHAAVAVVTHGAFLGACGMLFLLAMRRVLFRLNDKEVGG